MGTHGFAAWTSASRSRRAAASARCSSEIAEAGAEENADADADVAADSGEQPLVALEYDFFVGRRATQSVALLVALAGCGSDGTFHCACYGAWCDMATSD